ncbi:MAG: hypothetical protein RBG13Loki_2007 [Promethearchaeota archaeon CR_4]|nr:MAG: hypothetical protein RBG13Loki_2007 [Candidatus Lokiarchaeota archaeon CR_4]
MSKNNYTDYEKVKYFSLRFFRAPPFPHNSSSSANLLALIYLCTFYILILEVVIVSNIEVMFMNYRILMYVVLIVGIVVAIFAIFYGTGLMGFTSDEGTIPSPGTLFSVMPFLYR